MQARLQRFRWRRRQFLLAVVVLLAAALAAATAIDGIAGQMDNAFWRQTLLGPLLIVYILAFSPLVGRYRDQAVAALRRLAEDSSAFDQAARTDAPAFRHLVTAPILGSLLSLLLLQPWREVTTYPATCVYRIVATMILGALIGYVVAMTVSGTNLLTRLHRQRLRINVFDSAALEPIAKRSLATALFFLGGLSIGIVLIPNQDALGLILTGMIALFAAAVFFLALRNTHVVLVETKDRELAIVRSNLEQVYSEVVTRFRNRDLNEELSSLNTLTNVWSNYEKRLKDVPEWPFTSSMVRRLVLSTAIPVLLLSTQRVAIESLLSTLNLN